MNNKCQKHVRQSDFVTELKGSCKIVSKPRDECGVCCVGSSLYSAVPETRYGAILVCFGLCDEREEDKKEFQNRKSMNQHLN